MLNIVHDSEFHIQCITQSSDWYYFVGLLAFMFVTLWECL